MQSKEEPMESKVEDQDLAYVRALQGQWRAVLGPLPAAERERTRERWRYRLANARTDAQAREALANLAAMAPEPVDGVVLAALKDWRKARDLALIAMASVDLPVPSRGAS